MAGDSLYDIAEHLGVTVAVATKAYKAYSTAAARDGDPHDRTIATEVELARLDELMKAYWLDATQGGDKAAAKVVLDTINARIKLQKLDQLEARDGATLHQILVIGQNQAEFIRSLESGRKALAGPPPDNEIVSGTVEEELGL
jgi:hypothetical protein